MYKKGGIYFQWFGLISLGWASIWSYPPPASDGFCWTETSMIWTVAFNEADFFGLFGWGESGLRSQWCFDSLEVSYGNSVPTSLPPFGSCIWRSGVEWRVRCTCCHLSPLLLQLGSIWIIGNGSKEWLLAVSRSYCKLFLSISALISRIFFFWHLLSMIFVF